MLFDVCQFHSWASLGEPTLPVQCVFSWLGSFPLRCTRPCLCSVLATTVYLRPSSEEASGDTGWCFQRHLHRLWNYEHPEGRERLDGRGQGPHGDHRILQEGKRRVRERNHEPGEPPRETPCQFKTNKQQQWTNKINFQSQAHKWSCFLPGSLRLPPGLVSEPGRCQGQLPTTQNTAGWKNSPVCGVAGALPAAAEASQRGLIRPPHSLFHTRYFHEEGRLWAKYDFFFKFKN